ncbi:MAG TPA: NAD(+)/NADH kinase [Gemmatimonadaceae bacterium]|jgi:NAD+ kinase|nr:NAD(+)/NADH kinase [Gemmatimonadaceae bacterium]
MRLGVIGHQGYEELPEILRTLFTLAPTLGIEAFLEQGLHDVAGKGARLEEPAQLDGLVTLGGDGTLLRGARFLDGRDIPILGVNLGRLGFLTSCQSEDFEAALRNLASGDYVAQPRMALNARVIDQAGQPRKQWRALNDFVLHKGGFARVVRLNVFVDDESIGTYAADGIVISTPTGSTAYSLSAGGPVVVPTLESIVLTPISPHTLAIRSLVIPADAEVTVEANESPTEMLVTVDGQVGTSFVKGEKLKIRKADSPVRIVRFPGATFFERMRVKLGWGGLPGADLA